MKQFRSFVRKEFIHILRDPRSLLILLVMPVILVLLLGYVIKNDVKDIRVAVIDPAKDVYTTLITERIAANRYFIITDEINSEREAMDKFRKGEIDIAVIFSPCFADRLVHSSDASIQILSDGSEPNQASVRVAYAQQVIDGLRGELLKKSGEVNTMNIKVSSRMLFNPQQRSEVNFVPGIVGMVMLLICCMMTSIAIVRERETGTMEILLASPLPPIYIVIAKLIPYMLIALTDLVVILCLSVFLLHIPMTGSLSLYIFVSVIYIFTSLMLGLLISTIVNTQLAAMLISLLLIVPAMYLSGMVFDINSMPKVAQIVSNIVPTKWFITASRKIMIEGVEVRYVVKEIMILIGESVVFLLLSWKLFKTRLE
ncbi:MAG: ABC transporter permease [Paramuribaculum sp.]|nr:ABC transporter permease [Paramuribaculum sp.]